MAAKQTIPRSSCVHLFGAGHPSMFALAAAMGCDLFDSAAYALYAKEGRYLTSHGSFKVDELTDLPCACAVCRSHTAGELKTAPDRTRLLALHNLAVTLAEIARIRQAITDGTLWELVNDRCGITPHSSPVTGNFSDTTWNLSPLTGLPSAVFSTVVREAAPVLRYCGTNGSWPGYVLGKTCWLPGMQGTARVMTMCSFSNRHSDHTPLS